MANYTTLKSAIEQVIKTNGNNEITGALLQQSLLSMINSLGAGYQFIGVAVLSPTPTNPGTPDYNVFYIAGQPGTYSNFGGLVVNDGEIAILKYNGTWTKDVTGAATAGKVMQLGQEVDDLQIIVGTKEDKDFDFSLYTGQPYFVNASGKWENAQNANTFTKILPIGPGTYKLKAATSTQCIYAILTSDTISVGNTAPFAIVGGVQFNYRSTLAANTETTIVIDDESNARYIAIRTDTSGVLPPQYLRLMNGVKVVQKNELEKKLKEINGQINGVFQPGKLQINRGWMDSSGKVSLIGTNTHFVVPVKKGDFVATAPNSNNSVYAFLASYTPPTANGQSYDLCVGSTRLLLGPNTSAPLLAVPDDAKFLFVGIGDEQANYFPRSLYLNGIDVLNTSFSCKQHISLLPTTALPAATYIPTANADFFVAYGKVKKGDRILVKGDLNGVAQSLASSFSVNYAFYDSEPQRGMDASHILSTGTFFSYHSKYIISDYDGYFAAHFRPVVSGQNVTNLVDIVTTRTIEELKFGIDETIKEQGRALTYLNHSTISDVVRKRNTYNTPLFNCHRGVQAFGPENSLPAFLAGGLHNVWAIETDLRITSDGKVVCMHDASINRTMVNIDGSTISGTVNVSSKTLSELRTNYKIAEVNSTVIPNKQYNYASFTVDELVIPTMEDYLCICQRYGLVPFIELKEDNGVIAQMILAIEKYRLVGRCVISSSSIALLKAYRAQGGQEFVHHIFSDASYINDVIALGNSGLAFDISNYDGDISGQYEYGDYNPSTPEELVQMCHSLGLLVCFRAVDDRDTARKAIGIGLDYMPTNNLWAKSQID